MASSPGEGMAHIRLERRRANLLFSSWRLSSSIAREQGGLVLPWPAAAPTAADTDYVTARHAALLNALTQQPNGCYAFLEEGSVGGGALALHQLELGEPGAPPALHRVCREWPSCCAHAVLLVTAGALAFLLLHGPQPAPVSQTNGIP